MTVAFLFTNPAHHLEMMLPVARELRGRDVRCRMISLAEIRGLASPTNLDVELRRALPINLRRNPRVGANIGHPSGGKHRWVRTLAQRLVALPLVPIVRRLIGDANVVVVPNDAAFPYRELIATLGKKQIVLMQEGIRFDFEGDRYGTCGSDVVCAWGEASAEVFAKRGVPAHRIAVTGAPRLDSLTAESWTQAGAELRARYGFERPPIAYLSNPIETQGFGTNQEKLQLFERFLVGAAPVLEARKLAVMVKPHPNEDAAAYAAIGKRTVGQRCIVCAKEPLHAAIAASEAAVVLASTVGIDALLFGLPLGSLEIPGHGFGFEYVERGGSIGLRLESLASDLEQLLARRTDSAAELAASRFVERHLKDRGRAARNVADLLVEVSRRGASGAPS